MQGACGRAVVRAAIVIVALIVGAGWSSVSAQSGGIVATPVIPGDPGGLAPASVDVVVLTADGLPLPAQGELCIGRQCQSIGGLESGRRVSFTDVTHGWAEVTVRVSERYQTGSTTIRVTPGRLVTVEVWLQLAATTGEIPVAGSDGDAADGAPEIPAPANQTRGVAGSATTAEADAPASVSGAVAREQVKMLPETGAGASGWSSSGAWPVGLGLLALLGCLTWAMAVRAGRRS